MCAICVDLFLCQLSDIVSDYQMFKYSYCIDSSVLDSNMMACQGHSLVRTAATPCPCYQGRSGKMLRKEAKVSYVYNINA